MFTGIVEEMGEILSCARDGDVYRLAVKAVGTPVDLPLGASVAVNGCCLTVTSVADGVMTFDLARETVARTHFDKRLQPGTRVNLERPLRMSSRLDGHFVQGHVDGVARVDSVREMERSCEMTFELPAELSRYCVEKGSVAIDGVSLTCAQVKGTRVTVALIPRTLEATVLGRLKAHDLVNVEVDIMAKYVEKLLAK